MRKINFILAGMITLFISLQMNAQAQRQKGTPSEAAKKQGDEWQKKLSLTDDEKAKFIEARTAQLTKLQGMDRRNPENRTAARASASDFENSLKAAFTPEHFEAWKKTREDMKKNRQDRKGRRDGSHGPSPDGEKDDLD